MIFFKVYMFILMVVFTCFISYVTYTQYTLWGKLDIPLTVVGITFIICIDTILLTLALSDIDSLPSVDDLSDRDLLLLAICL